MCAGLRGGDGGDCVCRVEVTVCVQDGGNRMEVTVCAQDGDERMGMTGWR